MNLQRLQYLVRLSELAERGEVEDHWPALRGHIVTIEREMAVELVRQKGGKFVGFTPMGQGFIPRVRQILANHDQAVADAKALASGEKGLLRLGLAEETVTQKLCDLIAAFTERFPGIAVEISERMSADLISAIKRQEVDLALILRGTDDPSITAEVLWTDEWMVALPKGHPLSVLSTLTCVDLAEEEVFLSDTMWSEHGHILIEEAFRRNGIEPRIRSVLHSRSTMLVMVMARLGCTFVPGSLLRSTRNPDDEHIVFRPFQAAPLVTSAVYLTGGLSCAARNFLKLAAQGVSEGGG